MPRGAPGTDGIAVMLHSIRTTGGNHQDGYTLAAVLGNDAPYLDDIRNGTATAQAADELERLLFKKDAPSNRCLRVAASLLKARIARLS